MFSLVAKKCWMLFLHALLAIVMESLMEKYWLFEELYNILSFFLSISNLNSDFLQWDNLLNLPDGPYKIIDFWSRWSNHEQKSVKSIKSPSNSFKVLKSFTIPYLMRLPMIAMEAWVIINLLVKVLKLLIESTYILNTDIGYTSSVVTVCFSPMSMILKHFVL